MRGSLIGSKVLEYYGVTMEFLQFICHELWCVAASRARRNTSVPLSRTQLYVDGLHLSRDGHWVQTFSFFLSFSSLWAFCGTPQATPIGIAVHVPL